MTNETESKHFQCRHILADGHRCGSKCLRGEQFCYYHHTTRRPAPKHGSCTPQPEMPDTMSRFDLPLPEDRSAIQASSWPAALRGIHLACSAATADSSAALRNDNKWSRSGGGPYFPTHTMKPRWMGYRIVCGGSSERTRTKMGG